MDKFDKIILEFLQENNLMSQRDIGEKIGLSAAAVQRRIKKMREKGIIKSDISVIDRDSLTSIVTLMVEIFLESEKIEFIDESRKSFVSCSAVQQCYYVTGESDFILIIAVTSMSEYEKLTRELFFSNKNIKRFRTVVVMGAEKVGLVLPIN
ncbi:MULTISPECIES: Lrp/AsnC family transcriptional regulator [Flavobacterium]|uniref:Lrp/AsnC family transcriptional regulator n=1 Tax=Flavobacterium TaxID=237 RepID=UPI001182E38C|nr:MULTISPECIES: Lrp/AsnC family transcriptional regulator [Flavobacterium]MCR4033885.1 Lrp/AsnC family transcriptional regulator [Flavobacterium panacis]